MSYVISIVVPYESAVSMYCQMWSQMLSCVVIFFVFFKQKTAYEMRISDWSSDVCSSDLQIVQLFGGDAPAVIAPQPLPRLIEQVTRAEEIGRASCRERVCQYV